jgi:uncharacterized RDD family membrane protein YckC
MSLDDRYVTPTPEGVSLDVALAGLGSRFAALALDTLVQSIVFIGLLFFVSILGQSGSETSGLWISAFFLVSFFVIYPGYFIVCEVAFSGRTLGKRVVGIRVVTTEGLPISFWRSLLRTVARLVDYLPGLYMVGIVCILTSSKNQRLGDMLAGTLVVRERHAADQIARGQTHTAMAWSTPLAFVAPITAADNATLHLVDVSAVTDEEMALVHQFLARRVELAAPARARLAENLAARLAPRVRGVNTTNSEAFLAVVARAGAARR